VVNVDDPVAAVHEICAGPADFSLECTGNIQVCRQAVDSVGCAECALSSVVHRQGRFPFDELVTHFPFERIGAALEAAETGEVIKPVLRMP
jgi:Zn-dependent alcohol dehydrogenase